MKLVVVAKILQEAHLTSWNFSSVHWLHHPMNVKNQISIINSKQETNWTIYSSSQMHLRVMFALFPENRKSIP